MDWTERGPARSGHSTARVGAGQELDPARLTATNSTARASADRRVRRVEVGSYGAGHELDGWFHATGRVEVGGGHELGAVLVVELNGSRSAGRGAGQ